MSNSNQIGAETLQIVLDNTQALVYAHDVETHEIIFANKALKSGYPFEIEGRKCWEVLGNFGKPCPYCKLGEMLKKPVGEPLIWENYNPMMGAWLQMNDSIVTWPNGRKAHLVTVTDISKVKKNEEALKEYRDSLEALLAAKTESEEMLRAMSDNLSGSFVFQLVEEDGPLPTIKYMSKGVESICDMTVEELGENLLPLLSKFHPEDIERIQHTALTKKAFSLEARYIMPRSGKIKWLMFSEIPRTNKQGQVVWDGIAVDITASKQQEQSLLEYQKKLEVLLREKSESEEMLRAMGDNLPGSFIFQFSGAMHDPAPSKVGYISKGVESVCNVPAAEVMKDIRKFIEVFDDEVHKTLQRQIMLGLPFSVETKLKPRRDGEEKWVMLSGIPRFTSQGTAVVDGLAMDITARKKMEDALQKSQQELMHNARLLNEISANMANCAIYRTHLNPEGHIELDYASEQMEQITGYTIEQLQQDLKLFFGNIYADDRATILPRITATTGSTGNEVTEFRYVKDNQMRWYRLQSNGIAVDGQLYRDGIIIDITEQKRFETQLIKARDKAEESDKLKSTFIANMSHEIRTPMNAIIGFLDFMMAEDDIPRDMQKEYMRIVSDNANQLLKLIGDILDISKIDAGQMRIIPEETNINVLLQDLRSSFLATSAVKQDVELIAQPIENGDNTTFTVDNARLRQVLNNMVGNALKFTDSGYVRFGYDVTDSGLSFFVEDTGIGISEQKLKDLGRPFQQLHDQSLAAKYGGTGIGLAISLNLIKLMGGTFRVDSEMGKGSRFEFVIPCQEIGEKHPLTDQPAVSQPGHDNQPVYDLANRTLLIAEDMESSMGYLRTMLERSNATIITAYDGSEAVQAVIDNPQIEMVLMDVRMPGMDGLEATMNIKEIRPELPVIGQTAFYTSEDKECMAAAGFDDYLSKPVNRIDLREKIDRYLPLKH